MQKLSCLARWEAYLASGLSVLFVPKQWGVTGGVTDITLESRAQQTQGDNPPNVLKETSSTCEHALSILCLPKQHGLNQMVAWQCSVCYLGLKISFFSTTYCCLRRCYRTPLYMRLSRWSPTYICSCLGANLEQMPPKSDWVRAWPHRSHTGEASRWEIAGNSLILFSIDEDSLPGNRLGSSYARRREL